MKEIRRIEADKVRSLCIKNDYYTKGTCEEYAAMFDLCRTVNPSTNDFEVIATDIMEHSNVQDWCERSGMPPKGMIECIMFELINDCTITSIYSDDTAYQAYMQ